MGCEVVWGESCCYCDCWNSADRCGVKVDVWLWSCPVIVKGTKVVAKRDSSMRRMIEREFQYVNRKAFLDSSIVFYRFHHCQIKAIVKILLTQLSTFLS